MRTTHRTLVFSIVAAMTAAAPYAQSSGPSLELISLSSSGVQGDNDSEVASISADGRFVAFSSGADNLVPGDTNNAFDIFVRDRLNRRTERDSITFNGKEANGDSGFLNLMGAPSVSADGRFVAFASMATNLLRPNQPADTNGNPDVFVFDRSTGTTELISAALDGTPATGQSPSISADGRFVAFLSSGSNLVANDTNFADDIFVRDRVTHITERISVASDGTEADQSSFGSPILSANGRFVAFNSFADNLVAGDVDTAADVFVRDRQTRVTEAVSQPSNTDFQNRLLSSLSPNGRFVGFVSAAPTLVPRDTNGFVADAFVFDRQARTLQIVSRNSAGAQGDDDTFSVFVSNDGRFAVFASKADNFVANDTNFSADIFIRDLVSGVTRRVAHDEPGNRVFGFDIAITSVTPDALQVALVTRADLLPSQPTPFFTDDAYVLDLRVGPPTSNAQCLNGGWQNFTEPPFTSQGQCTNFVSGQP